MNKTRIQIEEGFRDSKSVTYGLGIANGRRTTLIRAANLLLIPAPVHARQWARTVHVSSRTRRTAYSPLILARLVIQHLSERIPNHWPEQALELVADYLLSMWQS